jgi:hypothetical protein
MGIILNAKCCVFRILMDWEIGDKKRDKAASKKKLKKKKRTKVRERWDNKNGTVFTN